MKNKYLFFIWILYYFLCVLLACIPNPKGALAGLLVLIGLGFFIPGGILLARYCKTENRKGLLFFRNFSLISLGLTVVMILGNFMAPALSETFGDVLYAVLILVSVPMVCCRVWVLSLFGWACYFTVSRHYLKKNGA